MVLDTEGLLALDADPAIGAVEQRDMGLLDIVRQGFTIDGEAVVHAGDLDEAFALAPFAPDPLDGVVGAAMALEHLCRLRASRNAEHLMPQTDTEQRYIGLDHTYD